MKFTKRFIVSVCLLLCFASSAFCINPFAANEGGFGPKVKGFQLGQKVSPGDLVSFFINNLDNVDANYRVCYIWTPISGEIHMSLYEKGDLEKLISKLEELSASNANMQVEFARKYVQGYARFEVSGPSKRLSKITFEKSLFGARALTHKEFLQEFINAYNIPTIEVVKRGVWRYRNTSQGYQVEYDEGDIIGCVSITPIVTKSAFD